MLQACFNQISAAASRPAARSVATAGKDFDIAFVRGKEMDQAVGQAAFELYTKQGKHLGEFDPESGHQTQSVIPDRTKKVSVIHVY